MECPAPIIFRPLKPPEPTRPGAFRAGGDGPSASLRASRGVAASARVQPPRQHVRRHAALGPSGTDPDNGTCPAMPMRDGAGKRSGAKTRRASCFSFGPFGYAE